MKVGETIGNLANKAGINLRQLAIKADVPYNTLYAIVKRKSERIDPENLQRLAAALGVDPYSLYSWDQATEVLEERINDPQRRVNAAMKQLPEEGQNKVATYAEDLIPRYRVGRAAQEGGRAVPAPPEKDTAPAPDGLEGTQEG